MGQSKVFVVLFLVFFAFLGAFLGIFRLRTAILYPYTTFYGVLDGVLWVLGVFMWG